jgi:tetrapyrrole methylase family protein/MazG family protein
MKIQRKENKVDPERAFIPDLKRSVRLSSRRSLGRSRRAKAVSSLSLAYQSTRKASRLGFDWPDIEGVLKKMDEEIEEFREALSLQNRRRIREELGDLFFVLVNISRFLRIDPEEALRKTVEKFMRRFHYIETSLHKKGKSFHQSNLIEMDQLWEEAKKSKKRNI